LLNNSSTILYLLVIIAYINYDVVFFGKYSVTDAGNDHLVIKEGVIPSIILAPCKLKLNYE
jgi:hypothetical protein